MKIFSDLENVSYFTDGCVLAAGNFDGVHRGHQRIFRTTVDLAREMSSKAVLLTFSRHPAVITGKGPAPDALMAVSDRLAIAGEFGFDAAVVLEFDTSLAAMTPEEFVSDILVEKLRVKAVVAGESWRFGHLRKGNMAMLDPLGLRMGFSVHMTPPELVDGLPVSSTRIRGSLAAGDAIEAHKLLGRPHFVRGEVVSGMGRGRALGFPTVNLECRNILVPGEGVYTGGYRFGSGSGDTKREKDVLTGRGQTLQGPAAVSIGSSPTFENGSWVMEAHLVGWKEDVYGRTVTIVFFERLRDQVHFPDAEALTAQIARDVRISRERFNANDLREIPQQGPRWS